MESGEPTSWVAGERGVPDYRDPGCAPALPLPLGRAGEGVSKELFRRRGLTNLYGGNYLVKGKAD